MILLKELFDDLRYGELAQFSVSDDIDELSTGISEADYPILISHLNKALTALHTRLHIKDREVTVQTSDELSFYVLSSDYAKSNKASTQPIKYIMDTSERPFTDDVLAINTVYDEFGVEYPINDETKCSSVWLQNYRTLQVLNPIECSALFVSYKANHTKIEPNANIETIEVDIPDYCIEPLLFYIASRMYARSNDAGAVSRSLEMMQKYEVYCQEIERRNMLNNYNNNGTHLKLEQRGFI